MDLRHPRTSARTVAAISAVALAVATAAAASPAGPASAAGSKPDPAKLSLGSSQPILTTSVDGDKSPTSALAETSPGLRTLSSAKRIPVMIKYDYDSVASYRGTVRGYPATSPSTTGKQLTTKRVANASYLSYVKTQERSISADVEAAAPSAQITNSYRVVYGGVSAVVNGNQIRQILRVPGVVAVQRDAVKQPLTDSSGTFIGTPAAYAALHTTRNAGAGILLGNLDTGVWPEHPSFADQGNLPAYTGPAIPCNFGDNPLTPANDPFVCNNKLVGGRSFLATYDAQNGTGSYSYPDTARDAEGHGSHTASTSAGNVVNNVQTLGPQIARILGMAPGAQIAEYRVCGGAAGCYTSDTTAATEQAILDGVDVINFSISGGTDPMTDPTELAFLDAYAAGVFVAASAGNDGPTAGTANHLSPWVTTVAASTQRREFASTLTLTADNGETFTTDGATITAGAGPLPVVEAGDPPYSNQLCQTPAAPGTFTGKIVICTRGVNARVEKGYNVLQGGAAGMILVNPTLADVETDNHWLPAIHIPDGTDLQAFMGSHTGVTGSFTAGAARNGQGDVMAAFSSRGPAGLFVKPDITAPGVQILGAMTPTPDEITGGPAGQYYQAIAGTSMSSPHIAGVAILLKALHPSWTPGQIKSAMMTQATTAVVKEDESTPADPFDMGAGRIAVAAAMKAPLTISDTAADFAALTGDPLHAIDLNIPSINAPTMPGRVTTTRTVTNVTSRPLRVVPRATVPANTTIRFQPSSRYVAPGQSASFQITIESSAPVGTQQFAQIRFQTGSGTAHIPVAFVPKQGDVSLTQSCAASSIKRNASTTCTVTATNNSFNDQQVSVASTTNDRLRITGASGAAVSNGRATASASLTGATLGVPSVDPGPSVAGYLPLDLFGIAPTPIGDEQFLNFNVPAFVYNGQSYSQVGVNSNGYIVVGGGTSADDNCCDLPPGPSSAPPNNMLAPFWTDLDGTGAAGVLAGTLTDGVDTWLVIEWRVNVFGTTDTRTFQTWIGVNGTQDISYTYSAPQADPSGQPYLVGAENAAGEGDVSSFLPAEDQVVTSTDPVPGDSLSYQLTVRGIRVGSGRLHSEMTADGVSGTTIVNTPVGVTP
ncbi:S8 family serine peptidase [Nocardioides mangrovi]|uniref:S8 family peptidase n=1 Tax=Nocardioides mangrovi TaxID=2874580 RepID=A0ABS7UFT3_9ACTN|nr:S8 family serine peptidase [Nocardioides mangrovi]MBZ5739861.1 S8 family peptidase [Nocardioides mangrovi]